MIPKKNLCGRGGAFPGFNAYVPLDFELEQKFTSGARFGILSGVSVFGLKAAMYGCGIWGERAKEYTKEIRFDRIMRWTGYLLDEERPLIGKILLFLPALIGCKVKLSPEFKRVLSKYLSWTEFYNARVADELYICIANQYEFGVLSGSKKITGFRDIYRVMKNNGKFEWMAENIHPYFGAKDGWYSWTPKKLFHKISDTITPLHELVYGTFCNPALKKKVFVIKTGHKKYLKIRAFDGGAVNNHANLVFSGINSAKPFDVVGCYPAPAKEDNFSDWHYFKARPFQGKYHYLPPTNPDLDFFGFTNAQIDAAYDRQRPPSNIFG